LVPVELTPSQVGARAERAVSFALAAAGKRVYLPLFVPDSRVDLLFEDEDGLHRVQCKTSQVKKGAIFFRTCSNTGNIPKAYAGEADLFGVYSPELDQVFLVPVAEAPVRGCHLRLSPTRNGQAKGIRWARDYALAKPQVNPSQPRLFAA
jgi:hypothetical protein